MKKERIIIITNRLIAFYCPSESGVAVFQAASIQQVVQTDPPFGPAILARSAESWNARANSSVADFDRFLRNSNSRPPSFPFPLEMLVTSFESYVRRGECTREARCFNGGADRSPGRLEQSSNERASAKARWSTASPPGMGARGRKESGASGAISASRDGEGMMGRRNLWRKF